MVYNKYKDSIKSDDLRFEVNKTLFETILKYKEDKKEFSVSDLINNFKLEQTGEVASILFTDDVYDDNIKAFEELKKTYDELLKKELIYERIKSGDIEKANELIKNN